MADVICTYCKREVSRYITKGPYCSLHCRDLAELDIAEKEMERLRKQVVDLERRKDEAWTSWNQCRNREILLRKVAEAAERWRTDTTMLGRAQAQEDTGAALDAARKGGAL